MSNVVVIGAGYAGVHAAAAARDRGADVTLVDHDGHHDLLPRLAAVAAGSAPVGDAWADAADLLTGVQVLRDRVARIDEDAGVVGTAGGQELRFDALVVTTGAEATVPDGRGLPLRTAADALRIRSTLPDVDRLVVIGAGATGVQLAAGAAAEHPDLDVHLIETERRILPGFPRSLSRHTARILRRRGVRTHLGEEAHLTDDGVRLADGRVLAGVVVWATGSEPQGSRLLPDAPTYRGRLKVDGALRVSGSARILAAGDVARHRDIVGRPLEMSAQIAVQAGHAAGANAARIASGDEPRRAHLLDLGWVIDLGGGRGVAQVGPFRIDKPLADRAVPLLHTLVDARHLLQVGGVGALLDHAPGRHAPSDAEVRRAERPQLRTVG